MTDRNALVRPVLEAAEHANDATLALLEAMLAALDAGAGATKVGAALGVGERTVRPWAVDGIPRPWKLDQ